MVVDVAAVAQGVIQAQDGGFGAGGREARYFGCTL